MLPPEDTDMNESWIEVTPQSLGYQPLGAVHNEFEQTQLNSSESGGFHTAVEEQLLAHLLTEAQEHSDRVSEASPRSPPPSRDGVYPLEHGGERSHPQSSLPPSVLLSAAASKAASLGPAVSVGVPLVAGPGEWPSRPEIGGYLSVVEEPEGLSSPQTTEQSDTESVTVRSTWSIRNSPLMKSRFVSWILDHIPDVLSHAATFLLGVATVFIVLRRRINWAKIIQLPLD